MDAQEIIDLLNERGEEFCQWIFPNGKRNGNYFEVGSLGGIAGDSLRVHLTGEKIGVWADYAPGNENARGATLVHLLANARGTTHFGKGLHMAKEWLGLPITPEEDRLFRQRARNGGKFETPSDCHRPLEQDGPVFAYLSEQRRISASTLARFDVRQHRTLAAVGFCHFDADGETLRAVKYLDIVRQADGSKKKPWSDPVGAKLGLWGKAAVDADDGEVVICEGEIDAMSVAEVGFNAVSMPSGAGDLDWIERDWRWLEQFRSVILCYDSDAAGKTGLDRAFPALVSRLGRHRCRIARLPDGMKDANDALQQDRQNELFEAISQAQSIDPEPLRNFSEYRDEVRELFFPTDEKPLGLPLPWTGKLRLRPGETTLWTGINGHGKTTTLLHCVAHLMHAHSELAIIASMEAPPKKSAFILCRQIYGHDIKRPEVFEQVYNALQERAWTYDFMGNAPWKDVIETFRYAWRRYGMTQFVVDSLMTCNIDTDDYNEQSRFIGALAEFANESQGHVHVVAHARKDRSEDSPPGKMDVAGHANLTNRVFNGLTVFRNKEKITALKDAYDSGDKEAIARAHLEHDAELICWKQRESGEEFHLRLWMHKASLQFWPTASPSGKPYIAVHANPQ
jgi:twinkle protein